jgi:hypothetical protein
MPHLQVRTATQAGSGGSLGAAYAGDGVQADPYVVRPGSLVGLLRLIADEGYNLSSAGGHDIETGGRFVFSVHGTDDDDEERKAYAVRDLLRANGYRDAEVYRVTHGELDDEPGALARFLDQLGNRLIHEIFVATPDAEGRIPVQVTTIQPVSPEA